MNSLFGIECTARKKIFVISTLLYNKKLLYVQILHVGILCTPQFVCVEQRTGNVAVCYK